MGLIDRATRSNLTTDPVADKKKSGLLNRIRNASIYDTVLDSFRSFMASVGSERGGVLYPSEEGCFSLLFASGFDFTTTKRFIPAVTAFADLPSEVWCEFAGSRLERVSSFFSSHERESLSSVFLRRIEYAPSAFCYIVLADSLLDVSRAPTNITKAELLMPELEQLLKENNAIFTVLTPVSTVNKSVEAMRSHAESAVSAKQTATLITLSCVGLFHDTVLLQTDSDMLSVFSAMTHRIAKQIGPSNIIFAGSDAVLHIALFTSLPADTNFYFYQLMKPLEKLFGVNRIARLVVAESGTSGSVEEILDFLTGEN